MVKRLIVLLLYGCSLYSSDVMSLYKSGGMKAIEQEIDKGLTDSAYWTEILKNEDMQFGYFENTNTLLTCSKEDSSLQLYTRDSNKRFTLQKQYNAFTGKYNGDKMAEGDHRTPIGIYTLIQKKKNIDPFYGPMAFVTSYPNLYDRIRGKNGSGIWIHGVPNEGARNEYTRGCIVINNTDLVQLDRQIDPDKTLLIIDSDLRTQQDTSLYPHIIGQIYRWRYAWMYNDLDAYLSFYDFSFKRFDGMDIHNFKSYKQRVFAKNETKTILFKNLKIVPYPGDKPNLYLVTFDENYQSDTHRFEGKKSLMITLNSDKSISILSEE